MLKIYNEVVKKQKNFWNGCVFHPTDAVEDPWGKRILDKMSEDGAINTIRIYAMFEDIVYLDGEDNLCFDFRLSDLRLDYLVSKGFDLLIAYAGMPECIARNFSTGVIAAKNKTRYKGKMWNTSPPISQEIWEEVLDGYSVDDILKIVNYFKDKAPVNPHLIDAFYLKLTEAEEKLNDNKC